MSDSRTFASSCLSSGSGGGTAQLAAGRTESHWADAEDRLCGLLLALRRALGRMDRDRRQLLLGCPEAPELADRLSSLQAYLEPAECAALRDFQPGGELDRRLRAANSAGADAGPSPGLRAALRRLGTRVAAAIEDAALLQDDVAFLTANGIGSGQTEERCVSRAFLSELVSRTQQAERENRTLLTSQAKLKRVLREAKEQRRQLKELARRLELERDQALLEVGRLLDQARSSRPQRADADADFDATSNSRMFSAAEPAPSLDGADSAVSADEDSQAMPPSCPLLPSYGDGARRLRLLPRALQDRRGKLRIFVRVRPDDCLAAGGGGGCGISGGGGLMEVASDCKIVLRTRGMPGASDSLSAFDCRAFYYDRVFGADSTSASVYGAMSELISSCCSGVNVCIMAYGQTGSGKTYTMVGDQLNPGVNRLSIASVLRFCRGRADWQYSFALSAVEIYKEEIRDLLRRPRARRPPGSSPRSSATLQPQALKLTTDANGESVIQGLTELPVTTEADIDRCIARCESTRIYSATNLNEVSSRSHVIVMLRINGWNSTSEYQTVKSTLTLCDLAGSESVLKSGVGGAGLHEASAINRSLLSLGKVFACLRKRQRPCFRESKLTRLLQPHLTGSSKCLVIVTVRQSVGHQDETVRSLMFGQSAMQTEPRAFATSKSRDLMTTATTVSEVSGVELDN